MAVIVPRVARLHYDENAAQYRVVVTGVSESPGNNQVFDFVSKFADLASALAYILSILAPVVGDGVNSKASTGNVHGFATTLTANYPSGYIPPMT